MMWGWPALILWVFVIGPTGASAEKLAPETQAAFDRYMRQAEARIQTQLTRGDGFLFATTPERRAALRTGAVLTEARVASGELRVPAGLIHDWAGAVYIPGASVGAVLELVQSYDKHQLIYRPEVIASRLLSRSGNDFRVKLRLLKRKAITVVLDTEHEIHYERRDETRWWSRSRSLRIAEVEDPGKPDEKVLTPGTGHGYVWALNTWWSFQQLDGGVYVECEAISLSRDVPKGLGWLIEPLIRSLPRESLANALRSTRTAGTDLKGSR